MTSPIVVVAKSFLQQNPETELIDQVMAVELSCWPKPLQASRDKFVSRLRTFPAGFFVALVNNTLVGVSTSQIITYPYTATTWDELSDNGYIKESHQPQGNALYVVSVGVLLTAQGKGIGSLLVEAQKQLARQKNLQFLLLGARLPGYNHYCQTHKNLPAEEYSKLKNAQGELLDAELRFYSRCGLKITKIVPNFEIDPDSRHYGAVMVYNVLQ